MSIEKISYYLSYTDCIPIINIPSGIAHLVCGLYGSNVPEVRDPEDFESLTRRKLDDWTHLQKAIAILTIVGTLFLCIKKINEKFELDYVMGALPERPPIEFGSHVVPEKLLDDPEFLIAAFPRTGGNWLFTHASERLRGDKVWIKELVDRGIFQAEWIEHIAPDLKNNAFVISLLSGVDGGYLQFRHLPEAQRNNFNVIRSALVSIKRSQRENFSRSEFYYSVLQHVTDKDVLTKDKEICESALRLGGLSLNDLTEENREVLEFAVSAVCHNHKELEYVPTKTLMNPEFHKGIFDFISRAKLAAGMGRAVGIRSHAEDWLRHVTEDHGWFQNFWADRKSKSADAARAQDMWQSATHPDPQSRKLLRVS